MPKTGKTTKCGIAYHMWKKLLIDYPHIEALDLDFACATVIFPTARDAGWSARGPFPAWHQTMALRPNFLSFQYYFRYRASSRAELIRGLPSWDGSKTAYRGHALATD